MKHRAHAVSALLLVVTSGASLFAACSSDPVVPPGPGPGAQGGACLLHNCDSDEQCAGCSEGRTSCLVSEGRCVACGSDGKGCGPGEECSTYGRCIPEGLECPTDNGVPEVDCDRNEDCAACDPAHQICDDGKCVGCTDKDTSECQSTDICVNGACSPACPSACHEDNDCRKCGSAEHPAKACNAHKCAECSPTYACPAGKVCTKNGVCVAPCGTTGSSQASCDRDEDCAGCGAETGANYVCDFPINGGAHGKCKLAATGCSDLGSGTLVLPKPFSEVSNTCSSDKDCANVDISLNVGSILRDLTGIDAIDDANIDYGMNACADIELAGGLSCGLCVPCKVDADCKDIPIDGVAAQAFGPLGSIGAAILLDQVFGPNEHKIFMYCETVGAGYGVCSPCPGVLNDCGSDGTVKGSGSCDHSVETTGGPLDPSCGACEAEMCALDSYCCETEWDETCVSGAANHCSSATCDHNECTSGGPLSPSCSSCADIICAYDPWCCEEVWDDQCVEEAGEDCFCP